MNLANSPPITQEDFLKKRKVWINCFCGKDRNSITNQIHGMIWSGAVFHIVNEARGLADGTRSLNSMVHQFIDCGFTVSQLMAIRRLLDKKGLHGHRGVYSFKSLLKDMEDNVKLMTRGNLFFDYMDLRKRDLVADLIEGRHRVIDQLSGVSPQNRRWTDAIQPVIFQSLQRMLDGAWTQDFEEYINKFIAHAATPQSRKLVDADQINITFGALCDAHKTIRKTAASIDLYFLTRSVHGGWVPIPQFNRLEHIDVPLVRTEDIEKLQQKWKDHAREMEMEPWSIPELQENPNVTDNGKV